MPAQLCKYNSFILHDLVKNKLDFWSFYWCQSLPLQREWRSEALHDLQNSSWIRLRRALRRALFTKRPCSALPPALISATQWRSGCSALTSGTCQICSHAFATSRGTQTYTDCKPHGGNAACHSGNVTQQRKQRHKGHVYCILQEWLHQGAMCEVLHYSETIWVLRWGFHEMKWNRTLNVSYNFIVLVSLRETVQNFCIFFYFFVLHLLPFARQKQWCTDHI